jgi:hypothetical protein
MMGAAYDICHGVVKAVRPDNEMGHQYYEVPLINEINKE